MRHRFILSLAVAALAATHLYVFNVSFQRNPSPALDPAPDPGTAYTVDLAWWDSLRLLDPATGTVPASGRRGASPAALPQYTPGHRRANATWTARGPFDVGGRTRGLAVDVTDERVLIAAGVSGGIWRSTDGGTTWSKVLRGDQLSTISRIIQNTRPGRTDVWYAGTGEFIGSASFISGSGVYKSTDGGVTWSLLPSTTSREDFQYVQGLALRSSGTPEGDLFATTSRGIFRSLDGGSSWQDVFRSSTTVDYDMVSTLTGVVYASTGGSQVWRSSDGASWADITPPGWTVEGQTRFAVAPSNENVLYLAGRSLGDAGSQTALWRYTYLSGDGSGTGGRWEDLSDALPEAARQEFPGYWGTLAVKPDDEDVVLYGAVGLYRSTDGFASTGSTQTVPPGHADIHNVVFLPSDPRVVYIANDGGVWRQDNVLADFSAVGEENRTVSQNAGYLTTQFYTVALNPFAPGDETIIGGTQDNGTFYGRGGADIQMIDLADGGFVAIESDGRHVLFSRQGGLLLRAVLDEAGQIDPETITRLDPAGRGTTWFIPWNIARDPGDERIIYYPELQHLWRNADISQIPPGQAQPSQGWTRLDETAMKEGEGWIAALGVSASSPPHRLYYGTTNGVIYRLDDAHETNAAPVEVTPDDTDTFRFTSSIAVDPLDGDRALVTFSNYGVPSILYTDDAGETWTNVGGNLEEHPDGSGDGLAVLSAAILPFEDSSRLYLVGATTGLYSTTELAGDATVWTQEGASVIGSAPVYDLAARASDGFVAVATHGSGLYSAFFEPDRNTHIERDDVPTPAMFSLAQNYPNPFRTTTTITYGIRRSGPVRLDVFDVQGRRVAALASGVFAPGQYRVTWDATTLTSGVYFYQLQAGGRTLTRQMTVVR